MNTDKSTWLSYVLSAVLLTFMSAVSYAQEHPAQTMVMESTNKLIAVLDEQSERIKTDKAFLDAQVNELIVPNLDFYTMTRSAVGKFWRQTSTEQKQQLTDEFKQLLLNQYTSALTEYSGETIQFQPFRPEEREDRAIVRSVFKQSGGGGDVPVIYKLRTRPDESDWKIYDINVNNISLASSFRSAFTSEINKGGIEGLLETMKKRNAKS